MANEIQELKFQVGEAWKGVYSSSTAYGLANVVQDLTGLSIYRSLKSGNVGHPVSDTSWWFCIIDMSSIKEESDRIAALNQAIAQDEALRVAAEELRQQHEAERVAAETQRNEAEQARISAEQQRETNEEQRITAEQGRVSDESARVQAEQARVLSETLRANAEDQRAANEQNRIAAEQQRIERAEQDHDRAESDHAALEVYFDSLGAFDISSYHATDGVLAKYADLAAALGTNGANIPDDLRKGGMSVKFVQSSDNKYVQYFLTKNEWSASEADWEKMNLEEEVSQLGQELNKLCKEKGVACSFTNSKYIDLGNGVGNTVSLTPQSNPSFQYAITPCKAGDIVSITAMGGATSSRTWGFIDANNILLSVADAPGVQLTDEKLTAPENATFVVINTKTSPDCYVISADNIPARLVQFTDTKDGFVPAPNGGTGFLKSDGTWANPQQTAIIDGETYNGITLVATDKKKLVARRVVMLDLDSVAYDGKTYREIFETGNALGINSGFDNGSYSPLVVGAGTPTIVSDVYDTAPNSLKCYGSTSQQLKTTRNGPKNSNVFLAFRGYCTRYASGGGLGVIFGYSPARLNEVTTGFVTRSAIVNANGRGYLFFVGTYQSADCDGYIDSPVAIDLSMFTNEPTLEEMTALYETYLSIKKGEQIIADIPMIDVSVPSVEPAVSKTKFVSVMNEYAKQAGMENSIFYEPSGISLQNQSTAEDICRLALVACANDKLQQYWGWETYAVNIMGENARTQVVTNTYKGTAAATLEADYHIFGGKSGTLSYGGNTYRNLFSVVKSKVDDSWLIGCIMLSTVTDRFKPMKDLFDWLEQKRVNPSVAEPTLDCSFACAGVVPNGNPCSFRDVDWMLCKYSETTQQAPFSMTKILTALVALDYCKLDEIIEVKASDVDIYGSGNYFQDGDKLTFRELLIGMLLPSSNTLANTICRVVGEKIIRMNK